jgi:hypothetical protein
MEISAGILLDELGERFAIKPIGGISYSLTLTNIMFLDAAKPPVPGRVFIAGKDAKHIAKTLADAHAGAGNTETPPRTKRPHRAKDAADTAQTQPGLIAAVAVTKDTEAGTMLAGVFESVLLVDSKFSTSKIHDAIQEVFAKYDYWDAGLHRILTSDSDIQALIDAGTGIFGNPLILHDVNFKAVAASLKFADEPALMPLLDDKKLPFLMQSERSRTVEGTITDNVMYLRANDMIGVSANLFRRGKFKYRLILLGLAREIRPHESALLEHLADYIRLALGLVTGGSPLALGVTGFMANVLSGEINSREYIEEQAAGFGWKADDEFVIYRVYTDLHEKNDRTLGFMTTRIADLFDEQCVFEHDDSIVAVFDLTARGGGDVPVDVVMADFLRDNNLSAGKSDVFTGFDHILQYYAQAGIANRLRPKVMKYDHLCRFRDVVKQYLVESCTRDLPASMVCAPELLRLKAYDDAHNTEFYRTLSVFLRSDLHSVRAARELLIARSTFIYRLERIQAITGFDLSKLSDRWYLLLSLELIEQAASGAD